MPLPAPPPPPPAAAAALSRGAGAGAGSSRGQLAAPGPSAANGFADVTFLVDGHLVQLHRCVLAARCEYFRRMLGGGFADSQARVIPLPEVELDVFLATVRYIYSEQMPSEGELDAICIKLCVLRTRARAHAHAHACSRALARAHALSLCCAVAHFPSRCRASLPSARAPSLPVRAGSPRRSA
jgi:hypothetical protein